MLIHNVYLFVEDYGHEAFLQALLERFAEEYQVDINIRSFSATEGHGKVISKLTIFIRQLQRDKEHLPDLLVVAIDTNCHKLVECRNEIDGVTQNIKGFVVLALPDPHIERWLLVDSVAFKKVLGEGCNAPDQKCDKDRYKQLLSQAVRETGTSPILGGMEYAGDIVEAMNLRRITGKVDSSLKNLITDLRNQFKRWKSDKS
ncbi:DUF4276 family protein [candidate division WOR-3 bacterium]|uniref:DUF4276 family protein n=1 Tax=candidate division WOR-3 bacterium TaxID=2052148 RepID=A0A9D5KAG7_UNCW3|nr:DUF4276 family protein [candidate division WOR-3 bacterium]MBD3365237.1 DUF4276 family protein [candidate division WOR-3 bacterium]